MSQPVKTGKHPKALYVLFLTEMWERFAYYLIAGILLLYLIDGKTGKGMDAKTAADIAGTFLALIWLPLFIGGYIADRYLGYIKSIFLGGALLAAGYIGLAIPGDTAMYVSMVLIIIGQGFFKPNISTLLGNIYNRDDLKPLKDNAYNIFYMGINTGAFVCNFVAAWLRNNYGWGYAFGAAGIGMIICLIIFAANLRHIRPGEVKKAPPSQEDMPFSRIIGYVFIPGAVFALIGYFVPYRLFHTTVTSSRGSDAFIFAYIPIIAFFISIWLRAKGKDKKGIGALLFIFTISTIFWAIFYQNFTVLTLWAEKHTDRAASPLVENIVGRTGLLQTVKAGDPYFWNVPQQDQPPPGKEVKLINAELFQSIGPLFIIVLTPIFVGLFTWLRRKGKEPTTASKFGLALFISGLSSLVMVFAVLSVPSINQYKVSIGWLWGTYFIVEIAEIFCSPIGLSLVSKLAPVRITALMMGGWFLTQSLGSKIAGLMTSSWDKFTDKKMFFLACFIAATIGGILIFSRIKSLGQTLREKTGTA